MQDAESNPNRNTARVNCQVSGGRALELEKPKIQARHEHRKILNSTNAQAKGPGPPGVRREGHVETLRAGNNDNNDSEETVQRALLFINRK